MRPISAALKVTRILDFLPNALRTYVSADGDRKFAGKFRSNFVETKPALSVTNVIPLGTYSVARQADKCDM